MTSDVLKDYYFYHGESDAVWKEAFYEMPLAKAQGLKDLFFDGEVDLIDYERYILLSEELGQNRADVMAAPWRYFKYENSPNPWRQLSEANPFHVIEITLPEFIDLCIIAGTYPQITLI